MIGGSPLVGQIAELKYGAEIVVCTPGSIFIFSSGLYLSNITEFDVMIGMVDMLSLNNGNIINLNRVSYVVLDEADRLFGIHAFPK